MPLKIIQLKHLDRAIMWPISSIMPIFSNHRLFRIVLWVEIMQTSPSLRSSNINLRVDPELRWINRGLNGINLYLAPTKWLKTKLEGLGEIVLLCTILSEQPNRVKVKRLQTRLVRKLTTPSLQKQAKLCTKDLTHHWGKEWNKKSRLKIQNLKQ